MTRTARFAVRLTPDGEPRVEQGEVHGFPASFNPDDGRFYLHNNDPDLTTITTFAGNGRGWGNLVQRARRLRHEVTNRRAD